MELFWEAFPGVPYRVETSVDGLDWTPAGTVQAPEADSMAFFEDREWSGDVRLYRVQPEGGQP